MDFWQFKHRLTQRMGNVSPDFDAQQRMAPFKLGNRAELLAMNKNPRIGGVLILVFNKAGEAHIALIKRPEYDGVHSGQIAFPGGKKDDADTDVIETALRETHEEIGVRISRENVLGQISQMYIPPSKFLVTPSVAVLDGYPVFRKDDFEVADILEVPVSLVFDDKIVKAGRVPISANGMKLKVPYFDIFGHMVWGATAIMLSEFKAIMK